jgi:hypothetical protein
VTTRSGKRARVGHVNTQVFLGHKPPVEFTFSINKPNLPRCAMDADFFHCESFALSKTTSPLKYHEPKDLKVRDEILPTGRGTD